MIRSILGSLLVAGPLVACGGEIPPLPSSWSTTSGDESTGATTVLPTTSTDTTPATTTTGLDSSTSSEPTSTTGVDSSTSGEPGSSTSGEPGSSSSGDPGSSSSSGGPACGNGLQEPGEDCDGADLAGLDCVALGGGFAGGTLACAADCTFDASGCTTCGNGVIDAGEDCDGALLGGLGCGDLGFSGGTLACDAACAYDAAACTLELWLSEYVEGGSNNKAVEVYNPTAGALALDSCEVRLYFNGGAAIGNTIPLAGSLAAGDVLVVCDDGIVDTSFCDVLDPGSFFNGDDAIELWCNGATLDVIGQIGLDPGMAWSVGGVSTLDHTLRRSCSVTVGDTNGADAFDPSLEWASFPQDTFADLGQHVCP
jgi:hypothetical protein